ncbi:unnamed protein product [Heterobilharzia americana]|nr:unnamed protein product [Heterobilharzia americana]
MNKILTDRTSIHVNETTGELPLTVSQMNDDDVDRKLKIECDESDQLESQIQNTLHDRETESNKLRPSSRRCTASSKFLTLNFYLISTIQLNRGHQAHRHRGLTTEEDGRNA